jgi:hypothetical protein
MIRHKTRLSEPTDANAAADEVRGSIGRRVWAIFGAVALLSTLPMIYYGSIARVEYDGWWHVFIAREDVWSHFWRDSFRSAHPPLYYLLLRAVSSFGTDPLLYRSISILAAAVGTMALGYATSRVSRTRAAPVLCALAFALAGSTVIIANEVRSYMLATALLLLALPSYLTLVRPGGDGRTRVLFAGLVILSFLSHYGVMLAFLAAVAAPLILWLGFPSYRLSWRSILPARWRADLATVAAPALIMGVAYKWQMALYRGPMAHLLDFYFSGEEPLWRFLARNVVREVDLFSPIELSRRGVALQALGVGLVLAIPLLLLWLLRRERGSPLAALFPLILITLTAAQMVGSIRGLYPFGGGLRHQFFIFPFAVATLFLLLDRLLPRLPAMVPRRVLTGVLGFVILLSAYGQWRGLLRPRAPLFEQEFAAFRTTMPDPEAVYLDTFDLFAFYGHAQELRWTFQDFSADGRLQIWRVEGDGESFLVLRDMRLWNPAPDDPGVYGAIRAGLDATGASSATIFRIDQARVSSASTAPDEREARREAITRAAYPFGLAVRRIIDEGHVLFLQLAIVEPGSPEAPTAPAPELVSLESEGIRAEPNPIQVCAGRATGVATLHWSFPGRQIDIRIGAPDGKLWGSPPSRGSGVTGGWVKDGMTFYVQDGATAVPTSPESTLGTVVVLHTDTGCPGAG